ncbi:hypothetical protein B0J13DRAFT_633227 [Dactylonectria estremocensis]|uniref:Uncharacterized protein n=1 Tax=Dactylonectria estremocensis TaxID=1079267 RepID=A0A9P9FHC9_9HYPO|nr:hypothetical protein B0J13DRAFT_633227 [Dactylonectria estremocensis]
MPSRSVGKAVTECSSSSGYSTPSDGSMRGRYRLDMSGEVLSQLTNVIWMPPPVNIVIPDMSWLRNQETQIQELDKLLRRPKKPLDRLTAHYDHHRHPLRSARLCDSHRGLDPRLIRHMMLLVARELTQRVDRFRKWRQRASFSDQLIAWLDRMDAATALWMGQHAFKAVFGYNRTTPVTTVESECEACILSVVGGRPQLLADVRASLRARRYRYPRKGRTEPRLRSTIESWIAHFDDNTAKAIRQVSDQISEDIGILNENIKQLKKDRARRHRKADKPPRKQRDRHLRRERKDKALPEPRQSASNRWSDYSSLPGHVSDEEMHILGKLNSPQQKRLSCALAIDNKEGEFDDYSTGSETWDWLNEHMSERGLTLQNRLEAMRNVHPALSEYKPESIVLPPREMAVAPSVASSWITMTAHTEDESRLGAQEKYLDVSEIRWMTQILESESEPEPVWYDATRNRLHSKSTTWSEFAAQHGRNASTSGDEKRFSQNFTLVEAPFATQIDKVKQCSTSSDTNEVDGKAPHPAPLHIIEAFTSGIAGRRAKLKSSSLGWSLGELDSGQVPLSINSDVADSIGPRGLVRTQENDHTISAGTCNPDPITQGWAAVCWSPPTAKFLHRRERAPLSDQQDIDTSNGTLMAPVDYPETYANQSDGPCRDSRDVNWRQAHMTSELWIVRDTQIRQKVAQRIRAELEEKAREIQPDLVEEPWPTANCLLRPVTPKDFAGIADIINKESKQTKTPQVFESVPVGPLEVQKMYDNCHRNLRPFVVAVAPESKFLDRSTWPEGAEYDEKFMEFVQFQQSRESSSDNRVLGFALVTNSRMGLFGLPCHGSRFTGRITVLVDPDQRRKLYGSALLDRILLSVAVYYRSLVDYKWECADPTRVYEDLPTKNHRQYARVYIESLVETGEDIGSAWISNFMEKFEFRQVARFEKSIRTDNPPQRQWLDSVFWEFEARPVTEIVEETP